MGFAKQLHHPYRHLGRHHGSAFGDFLNGVQQAGRMPSGRRSTSSNGNRHIVLGARLDF
jgi:hypothetical protein